MSCTKSEAVGHHDTVCQASQMDAFGFCMTDAVTKTGVASGSPRLWASGQMTVVDEKGNLGLPAAEDAGHYS